MPAALALTHSQLVEVARVFGERVAEGLAADGREIRCLPTYVSAAGTVRRGCALVVDLGGSNVRAAVVGNVEGALRVERGPVGSRLPLERGQPLSRERFLQVQVEQAAALGPVGALPLGYCFSYPAESMRDRDAVLLRWTKEVCVPGVEGERVGRLLRDALVAAGVQCREVTVVNDTVAAMLAGVQERADCVLGLIVGTGTNLAAVFDAGAVPKLAGCELERLPVNLESGNFVPPHLSEWDDEVDRASENPGGQRFEKAVSGVYLGRLLAAVVPAAGFDPESGSKGVVEAAARGEDSSLLAAAARQVLRRSAQLVGAKVAGLVALLHAQRPRRCAVVVAEGSLYALAPGYAALVSRTTSEVLAALGAPTLSVRFRSYENANLLGTAAAAMGRR
jgi:hexokinase